MKNTWKLYNESRYKISYSNSFVFRSRCQFCATGPCRNSLRVPVPYGWTDSEEYREENIMPIRFHSIRMVIKHISRIKDMKVKKYSMKMTHFRAHKNKMEREEHWPRLVGCKCGITYWAYKNMTNLHAFQTYEIVKASNV